LTELGDEGVQILAISPIRTREARSWPEARARYRFLTDGDLAVMRRYGLLHAQEATRVRTWRDRRPS